MLDKKINQTIDALIKKIKDNNLGSIKISNKVNTIEIENNLINQNANKNNQNILPSENQNKINETDSIISIDSPMVGVIYLTPKPSSPPFAKIGQKNKIIKIVEKPKKYISDYAITGIYFFDNKVVDFAKKLKPSKRGELEITDLLKKYKKNNELSANIISRGGAWLDTGSIDDYYKTTAFVSAIENRQGLKVGCPEEVAFRMGWIDEKQLIKLAELSSNNQYGKYLLNLL